MVLSWDTLEFRKSADAIEKAKGGSSPSKEQISAIRKYVNKTRAEHDHARRESVRSGKSIVVTILEHTKPDLVASLSETQHAQCLEYLSALLAARDRDEISNSLCRQNPDLFTQAIKDAVSSFEPMIRTIHQQVDLREHVTAAEGFITEFLNVSKAKKTSKSDSSETRAPSVEDYVVLLRNNRQLLYNWLHQVASQCPEIRDDFCAWAKETIKVFRQPTQGLPEPKASEPADPKHRLGAAGAFSTNLQALFASLAPSTQSEILPAIDAHATYLSRLENLSLHRMQRILDNLPAAAAATAPITTATTSAAPPPTSYFSPSYWSGRSTPRAVTPTPTTANPPPPSSASASASTSTSTLTSTPAVQPPTSQNQKQP
jgi:hypothetical protein